VTTIRWVKLLNKDYQPAS